MSGDIIIRQVTSIFNQDNEAVAVGTHQETIAKTTDDLEDKLQDQYVTEMERDYAIGGPLLEVLVGMSKNAPKRNCVADHSVELKRKRDTNDNEKKLDDAYGTNSAAGGGPKESSKSSRRGINNLLDKFVQHPQTVDNWDSWPSAEVRKILMRRDVEGNIEVHNLMLTVPYLYRILEETFDQNDMEDFRICKGMEILLLANACISDARHRITTIHMQLLTLARLTQAQGSVTTNTQQTYNPEDSDDIEYMDKKAMPTGKGLRPEIKKLILIGNTPLLSLDSLTGSQRQAVVDFNNRLQHYLYSTAITHEEKVSDDQRNANLATMVEFLSTRHSSLPRTATCCFPIPDTAEKKVQSYLAGVLSAFGTCLDGASANCTEGETPIKQLIQFRWRRYGKDSNLRIADGSISVYGRFIYLLRDDAIEVVVEIKPTVRKSQSPLELLREAEDQVYAHLAKHIGIAFNFGGAGLDGKATGIVLMPHCIKIIQLCLRDMGTLNAHLVGYESQLLPLLTFQNFDRLVLANKDDKYGAWLEALSDILYPGFGDRENMPSAPCADESEIPAGLIALARVSTASRTDLFGCEHHQNSVLGPLIGHGSYANIYSLKSETNSVIKISRYGANGEIEREATALRDLQIIKGEAKELGIVRLMSTKRLCIDLGGVMFDFPVNKLTPKGVPIWCWLTTDRRKNVKEIGGNILSALEFIHRRSYTHNDVCPNNILVDHQTGNPFLIDFGNAHKIDSVKPPFKDFVGTPPYVHSDIFPRRMNRKLWRGSSIYDLAGLAFSMASLLQERSQHPWKRFDPDDLKTRGREEFVKWVNYRSNIAQTLLSNASFDAKWLDWCNDRITVEKE